MPRTINASNTPRAYHDVTIKEAVADMPTDPDDVRHHNDYPELAAACIGQDPGDRGDKEPGGHAKTQGRQRIMRQDGDDIAIAD